MYMCGGVPCFKALSDGNDLCQYTYITYVSAVYLHTHQEGTSSPMVIIPYKCYLANLSQAAVLLTRWNACSGLAKSASPRRKDHRTNTAIDTTVLVFIAGTVHRCLSFLT
ncbi:hypothetical protein TWF173_008596 [Orbilia oligospora]|nr:hypothetical protein TWF173_008596 [Orbilia oligospora]